MTWACEADLGEPIRAWLQRESFFRVAEEVDSEKGIADFVVGVARPAVVARRLSECRPVPDALQLALLDRLSSPVSECELRAWAPWGWQGLKGRALGPLLDVGLIAMTADGRYVATAVPEAPFSSLIAIELKLRDARRGLAQAARYRLFAHQAYLAIPVRRVSERALFEAKMHRVGIIGIHSPTCVEVVLDAPRDCPLQPTRHRLMMERLLAAQLVPSPRSAGSPLH